jgi:ABC-2 type transport system permease protein
VGAGSTAPTGPAGGGNRTGPPERHRLGDGEGDGEAISIGGSTRFVPGSSNRQITIVNGKVELRQRLRDLWRNRDLLVLLIRTELKVKYKNSVLGYLWSMLNPALVLAIYYVVFKIIARNHQPNFAIWLFAGLLVWNLFNNAAMSSTTVVVGKAGIVKKVAFPRELLALSVAGVALVLFFIQVVVLILALLIFGVHPAFTYLALLPLALVGLLIFTGAISIFLSAVNVYLRDTQHLTEVLLMAWFWGTSIVYTYGQIFLSGFSKSHPILKWAQYVYLVNPITPIVMTFQRAIYGKTQYSYKDPTNHVTLIYHVLPTWGVGTFAALLGGVLVVSVVLFFLSLIVFGRLEGNFAEEL